jgi:hypothetical protein
VHHTLLHLAGHHRPTTRDREHILDRHQERLVQITLRLRDRTHHRAINSMTRLPLRITLRRLQRRHPHHRRVITRELVLVQQLPNLELHQIQKLLIIHHVALFNATTMYGTPPDEPTTHAHASAASDHPSPHHQDRPIHLRRTRDHVLDVIRMTRHIHMRVMTIRRLILHMRDR